MRKKKRNKKGLVEKEKVKDECLVDHSIVATAVGHVLADADDDTVTVPKNVIAPYLRAATVAQLLESHK
eukprot:CAMPEP_0174264638 /NCGR_PEP_ID=MMETSP0439-20130205/23238_1 /TAXON_ID=0 /ORGANISM="Stereomyxa ramosa, Strain Chinc5" /LENGTH=68 /DNA_ID=CAMNT_0015350623 /DNA_START=721 /DNA_END=927 /DNA_ORIENTATION=-